METQGTGSPSSAPGHGSSTSATSAVPPTAANTAMGGGRVKKKPPKSASSQFFSLLGQGASQVLLGRGTPFPAGPRQSSPGADDEESRHLLHLDDASSRSSSSSSLIGSESGIARGHSVNGDDEEEEHGEIEEEEREEMDEDSASTGTANTKLYHSDAEEEEEELEVNERGAGLKAKESEGDVRPGDAGHRRDESRAGPMSAPASPRVRRIRPKLLTSKGKAQSEVQVNDAEKEKARARMKKKRVVLVRKKPSEQETYNPKYFFLREYGSDPDSSSEEDQGAREDEIQHKGEQDKPSDDASPTTTTTELSSHTQKARRKKSKQKRGISGGWVMKRVLVMMGKKDKMKALLTSNPKRKASLRTAPSFHELESSSEGEGNDDLYEMMEVHSDDDVEIGETLNEKAREDQAELCRSLHKYGAPVHRLEYNMRRASESLNVAASFAVMPSLIMISIGGDNTRASETHIIRSSQALNCAKLFWTDELIARLANNEIELPDAIVELSSINRRKPLYPTWLQLLMFGICSASCSSLFYGGGWIEIALSFGLGLTVGLLDLLSSMIEPLGFLLSAVAAIICAFLTRLFITYVTPVCFLSVILAGIIWLLPGLSITISITELATGNMVSGTTRIFSAIIRALQLGFGMAVGTKLVAWTDESEFIKARDSASCSGIGSGWALPLFICVALSFNILLEAHPRQWGIMTLSALLSFTVTTVTDYAHYFSPETSSALAAFAVGALGNIHARLSGHPAIISIMAGILLLVPGSIGVKGVSAMMENDVISGIQFGFSMLTIALSICVGLLTANMFNLGKSYLGF